MPHTVAERYQFQQFACRYLDDDLSSERQSITIGDAICINIDSSFNPKFGKVVEASAEDTVVQPLVTLFDSHMHAYFISDTGDNNLTVRNTMIPDCPTMNILTDFNQKKYICPRHKLYF
jgi:hypothetical protein